VVNWEGLALCKDYQTKVIIIIISTHIIAAIKSFLWPVLLRLLKPISISAYDTRHHHSLHFAIYTLVICNILSNELFSQVGTSLLFFSAHYAILQCSWISPKIFKIMLTIRANGGQWMTNTNCLKIHLLFFLPLLKIFTYYSLQYHLLFPNYSA